MNESAWRKAPIWDDWLKLTRLQWSFKLALGTELGKWAGHERADAGSVQIADSGASYETSLANHLETLTDHGLFHSLIFMRSYALMERHCKLIQYIIDRQEWRLLEATISDDEHDHVDAIRLKGGIESWCQDLIEKTGQAWDQVYQGKVGLVEVSVVRNALAHGYTNVSRHLLGIATRRGCSLPFVEGEPLVLSFAMLNEYRGRMRSICRILGDGVIHLGRGTHWSAS